MAASKARGALWGITPNSPLTASPPAPTAKLGRRRENIFGRFLHNGDTIARARYVRKIFSAPFRTERERKNMDFQSISNFLVQRLGRERERESRTIRAREGVISAVAARSSSPFLFCTSFSPNCFFYPSLLLIPDNARARFPLRLAHIKRQQCLNPFIIFPLPRVLSISPSSSPPPNRVSAHGDHVRLVALECVHSATREYKQFRQTREDGRRTLSSDSMIGGRGVGEGEQGDFGDKRSIRPICGGMDSLRLKLSPYPCQCNNLGKSILKTYQRNRF